MLRALAPNMQTATCLSDVDLSDEMRYTLHTYAAWHQTARNHLAAGSEHIKTLRFRCLPESGGLGDQLKGLLLTFLLALTAERQRAFFIDCSYNVPLETVWLPCLGLTSSIDWRWDPRWPLVVNNIAHDTRVEYFGMAFDEIAARTSLSWAAGHRTTEMYFEHFRVLDSFSSIVKVAQPLLGSDTIHIAFTTNLMRHEVFNLDGRGTILWCSKARCKTPSELQLLWGNGPVGSNRMKWAFSLLDYLFRPSPALLQTLCNQIGAECYSDGLCVLLPDSVYSKHRPYLVGVHARMGGSSGTFVDPQRAPPETVTLLASCAQHVVDHMIKVQGPRAGIVWFLCSDANQWLIELRIAAARAGVQVAEFSSSDLILHVDKTAVGEVGQQAAKAGFIKAYGGECQTHSQNLFRPDIQCACRTLYTICGTCHS